MAINFFNPPRSEKNTPYAAPLGYVGLFGQEDMLYDPTKAKHLQRINNRFLQEPEEYDQVQELGVGGNGKAILLERRRDRSLLAVKIVKPFPGWSTVTIAREVFLLKHRLPENDRIIRIMDYLHSAHVRQIQIYMEYCNGGDLQKLLDRYHTHGRILPESFAWHAFRQIAEGLAFIHYGYDHELGPNQKCPENWKKVIHADLKPENIFLRTSKSPENYPDLVLADFGNSQTEEGYHSAGTEIWLPPERRWVSEYGDTWTMGAIISSFAWGGSSPARPSAPSHLTFQRGLDSLGPPILIRHQFGILRPGVDPARCAYERDPVFVRPMLMYSHELNDLVADASNPHAQDRITSWDCLQVIWYEMEVGAARSHPFVPLMSGWEPHLPARIPNDGESNAAPEKRGNADDDNRDHRNSSHDSSDGGEDPPGQGGTRKRKRIGEEGDEENRDGQDPPDQSPTGKRMHSEENGDKENHNGRHTPDRGSTRKRRHVGDNNAGNRGVLGSPKCGPIGKRRHLEEGSDEESHDRQDSPNRGSTIKRKHVEQGDDEEHHDGQDRPERGPTKRRRRYLKDTEEEVRT